MTFQSLCGSAAVIFLAGIAVGCGDSAAPSDPAEITFAGAYTMQSVNGQPLPFVGAQSGGTSVTLIDDRLTIDATGTWSESATVRSTQPGTTVTQTVAFAGTWARSGTSLVLIRGDNNQREYSGTFSSGRLDMTDGTFSYVFRK